MPRRAHNGEVGACPILETDRLILRNFRDDDVDAYFGVLDTPEVRAWLHLPETFGRERAWAQMAGFLGEWELRGTGQWALEEKETGRFVGRAGLYRPERDDWPGVEVGWTLHPDSWGLGYATEAGRRAVAYGFEEVDVDRLFSCILPDNKRSQSVAGRLGFTLLEERVLAFYPDAPHGIWFLDR